MNKVKMAAKKYFLAIVIPSPEFEKIEAIKTELFEKHQLKGALRSPAHITLHMPFEWKEEKENLLIGKLREFSHVAGFQISLNGFAAFEPRVLFVNVIPNHHLETLQKELTQFVKRELNLFNQSDDKRGFHPHITIASRDLKKPKFYELLKEFSDKEFKGSFQYSGFSLLRLDERWKEICFLEARQEGVPGEKDN